VFTSFKNSISKIRTKTIFSPYYGVGEKVTSTLKTVNIFFLGKTYFESKTKPSKPKIMRFDNTTSPMLDISHSEFLIDHTSVDLNDPSIFNIQYSYFIYKEQRLSNPHNGIKNC
jgi:hypothetical protein